MRLRNLFPKFLFTGAIFVTYPYLASGAQVTLQQSWDQALRYNESLPTSESQLKQAEERVSQTYAAMMPTINFTASFVRQETPSSIGGSTSFFFQPDQANARFTLTQPIFQGMREYAGLRRNKAALRSSEAAVERTKVALFRTVNESFYSLLSAKKDKENLEQLLKLTDKRISELAQRVQIGRTRKGDLLSAKAQSATLKASLEAANSELAVARENFIRTTGFDASAEPVEVDSAPEDAGQETLGSWNVYEKLLESRPDIRAEKEAVTAADEQVTIAFGGHLPTINFVGNYYLRRPGSLSEVRWDAGAFLTFPLFTGGLVQSQVREATEARKTQELLLAQTRRNALRESRTLYNQLKSLKDQLGALKIAVGLAEQNYEEQNRDYRLGLVNNLEVLQALNTLQESRRAWDRAQYQEKLLHASFQASLGKLP